MNWLIDAAVFLGAVLASLSGIYFLFLPSGYEGGRNPWYDLVILFDRHTWDQIHMWGGILMMAAVAIHLVIHVAWIKMTGRRTFKALFGNEVKLSKGAWINVTVDLAIAISFLLAAVTGVYFLFAPTGGFQGGSNLGWDPYFLFSRSTWDLIHTWSGNVMIAASLVHIWIHWLWITKVTKRFLLSLWPQPEASKVSKAPVTQS